MGESELTPRMASISGRKALGLVEFGYVGAVLGAGADLIAAGDAGDLNAAALACGLELAKQEVSLLRRDLEDFGQLGGGDGFGRHEEDGFEGGELLGALILVLTALFCVSLLLGHVRLGSVHWVDADVSE